MRNNVLNSKHTNNNNMESFYEDGNAQYAPTTASTGTGPTIGNGNGLKRPATLELNPGLGKARKTRYTTAITIPAILPSPDLQMLKLVSPELEKIISHNAALPTPTPSAIIFPPSASAEQQQFAKGFEDALLSIHQQDTSKKDTSSKLNVVSNNNNNSARINNNNSSQTIVVTEHQTVTAPLAPPLPTGVVSTGLTSNGHTAMSGGEMTYTNLDNYPGVVKEEPPATGTQSPPVSPIDMESQERIKLERKRLRNRVAASKCRRRKLERISKLEDKVKDLKTQNTELGSMVCNLKQHIFQLKQQVLDHHNSGCTITLVGKF